MRLRTRLLAPFALLVLAAAAHAAEVFVTVSNFMFTPQSVTINPGDTVTWTNAGGFHNVVSDTGLFTSGPPSSLVGWTFSHTFPSVATFPYHCEVHVSVGMSGVVVVVPSLSIADLAVVEGNTGTTAAVFTVTLSAPSTDTVTVMFQTADGTALAGSDYTAAGGMLTFAPGTTTQTATVSVTGDTTSEDNETFFVRLTSPTNATIADSEAVGTILDDDAADFFALAPCRVVDTRLTPGPGGGPALPANGTRAFPVTGLCGVPADARAIALNVTTVNEGDLGDLRLYPADAELPAASTINFSAGKTRANNALTVLGTGGKIAVRNDMPPGSTATTDVVIDVSGYFKRASGGSPAPAITGAAPTSVAKGSTLIVDGSNLGGASSTLGGVSQVLDLSTSTMFRIPTVDAGTPTGVQPLLATTPGGTSAPFDVTVLDPLAVVSAAPSSATTLEVTFSRALDAATVSASDFAITGSGGLAVSAVSTVGAVVTLTTSTQTPSAAYLLDVTGTVTDQFGNGLTGTSTAPFSGF